MIWPPPAPNGAMWTLRHFSRWLGAPVTPLRAMLNVFSHARAVYPLSELVTAETLPAVQSALHLDSPLRLVDTVELRGTGVTGSLTLRFVIDEFKQIYGEPLVLMEGAREVLHIPVRAPEMILDNLPIGAYTIRPPTGQEPQIPGGCRLSGRQGGDGQPVADVYLQAGVGHDLPDAGAAQCLLRGEWHDSRRLHHHAGAHRCQGSAAVMPCVTGLYAAIGVKNGAGGRLYAGDQRTGRRRRFAAPCPSRSAIGSRCAWRMPTCWPWSLPRLGCCLTQQSHVLTITALGLQNAAASNNPEADLLARIAAGATIVREHLPMAHAPYAQLKDDLYLAVMALPPVARTAARREYMDVMSTFNFEPDDYVGNLFTLTMKGITATSFCTVTIDLEAREIRFQHHWRASRIYYFSDTYGYVSFSDVYGNEVFSYDFIGTLKSTGHEL